MTSASSSGLVQGTASLLNSEKDSDLTITTSARSFKVHKAIICTKSKVLAAMSNGGFKESSTSNLILKDDDPATVERMLTFFYTGTYDDSTPALTPADAKPDVGPILMANTLIYAIADKYDIEPLKKLANAKFRKINCCTAWNCAMFSTVVVEIFDSTPDNDMGLRSVVSNTCARHIDDVLSSEEWNQVLTDNGAIGLEIFKMANQRFHAKCEDMEKKVKGKAAELEMTKTVLLCRVSAKVREDYDSIMRLIG